ncbi:MAG: hypothetical protein ACKOWC_10395 [Limnohabitans sp.]
MESIIVVIDDPEYALKLLTPMKNEGHPTQWVLLVCPPRLTRHIGRWVNLASRDAWRNKWTQELLQKIRPLLQGPGDRLQWRVAKGALAEQTRNLQSEFVTHRVLDARRPRFAQDQEPVTNDQPTEHSSRWALPGGAAAMGAALLMAAD